MSYTVYRRCIGMCELNDNLSVSFFVKDYSTHIATKSKNCELNLIIDVDSQFNHKHTSTVYNIYNLMIYEDLKEIIEFINDRIDLNNIKDNEDTIDFFGVSSPIVMAFKVGPEYPEGVGPNGVHLLINSKDIGYVTGQSELFFDYNNTKRLLYIFNEEYKMVTEISKDQNDDMPIFRQLDLSAKGLM